jgi:hypothetical protein
MMIVVDIDRTNVFVRENGRSDVIRLDCACPVISYRLSERECDAYQNALKEFEPQVLESGAKWVLYFYGDRGLRRRIKYALQNHGLSTKLANMPFTEFLRYRYPVFSKVAGLEPLTVGEKAGIDELMAEKRCTLDIEVQDYETSPKVFMVAVRAEEDGVCEDKLFSLYDTELDADVIRCRGEEELITELAEFIMHYDPLFVSGYNLMNYDLPVLREHGKFNVGVDGSEPKIQASTAFGKKVGIKGRHVIDAYPFLRNNVVLPDYGLETACEFFGIGLEKEINYEEMDKLAAKAGEDRKAATVLGNYNLEDVRKTAQLCDIVLRMMLASSLDFDSDPTTVSFKSKPSRDYHKRKYFMRFRTPSPWVKEMDDFDERKIKDGYFLSHCQGLFNESHLYFTPLIADGLRNILEEDFGLLYKNLGKSPEEDLVIYRQIEKAGDEILFLLQQYECGEADEWLFKLKYSCSPQDVRAMLDQEAEKYGNGLINFHNGFGAFSELLSAGLHLGDGRCASMCEGSFVFAGDRIYPLGFDVRLRGMRTDFERKLVHEGLKMLKGDENELSELLTGLDNHKLCREDLVYRVRAGRDYYSYAFSSRGRRSVKIIQEDRMMRGDEKEFGYLLDGRVDAETFLDGDEVDWDKYMKDIKSGKAFEFIRLITETTPSLF